ncbi:MAG: class I SAM-dependent methyltransferase [Caulobacterales bacterium]
MDTPPNLRPDAFAGTAAAYLRYRPPYPKALLDDLLSHTAAPSAGALLDLACGPGRVVLDLADVFDRVWAIDLEPEMIDVGKREAARRGIGHVNWLVGRAEDLELAPCSLDLITIGEAFHRLDQLLIARKALDWLKPGGWLATLGTDGVLAGREPWQKTAAEVARRWTIRAFPAGWAQGRPGADIGPGAGERVMRKAGFADVESRTFLEPRDWSFEDILGYLKSTSVCSEKALGKDFADFEAGLAAALANEHGPFHEDLNCGYTVGRRRTSRPSD